MGWREIGGGGDCINIKIYFRYFPQLSFLKLEERRKKSLCAVKHANGGAGKNRRAQYYLDFISRSLTLSFLPYLPLLSLHSSHSFCILMAEGSWHAVIA